MHVCMGKRQKLMTLGRIIRRRSAGNNLTFLRIETCEPQSNTPVSIQVQVNFRDMQRNDENIPPKAVKWLIKQTWRGDWIGRPLSSY